MSDCVISPQCDAPSRTGAWVRRRTTNPGSGFVQLLPMPFSLQFDRWRGPVSCAPSCSPVLCRNTVSRVSADWSRARKPDCCSNGGPSGFSTDVSGITALCWAARQPPRQYCQFPSLRYSRYTLLYGTICIGTACIHLGPYLGAILIPLDRDRIMVP